MNDQPEPCVFVIFGASGDLAARKLVPALYELARVDALPRETCILGVSRTRHDDEAWRDELRPWVEKQSDRFDDEAWTAFAERIFYEPGDATESDFMPVLRRRVEALSERFDARGNVLLYLSVAPSLYEPIVERLDESGLVSEGRRWCSLDRDETPWQRIVVEKPLGRDIDSAASLNRALGRVFEEDAIYRIDHYLGKELVQGLLALRFANTIFEPVWSNHYIDHVQITAAEQIGVADRVRFYDETGAIRDMIQSHLLQLLALVAMEPPTSYTTHHIREEKIKVIDAIAPPPTDRVAEFAALGQYAAGGEEPAYDELPDVVDGSRTETFAALELHVESWRWAGTPFYVRTGKRLAEKRTEIVVTFKPPAADLFGRLAPEAGASRRPPNRIVIEIAPRGGIELRFEGKVPGPGMRLDSVAMDFDYARRFGAEPMEAYGPLLLDAMRGDQTLFKHRYEVEGAWRAVMPFLGPGADALREGIAGSYEPGSWGPDAARALLARAGRAWREADDRPRPGEGSPHTLQPCSSSS